jgi:hypothetical protein
MSKRLLLLAKLATVLLAPLASYAQTENVTLLQTEQVSQTTPAPDCSGLTGLEAGFCAGQRQNTQTPTPYTYYTLESVRNTYVLSCRPRHLWSRCPVMAPGQQFTLSVEGSQVLLRADGSKDLKLGLVEAQAIKPENRTAPATPRPTEASPASSPVATQPKRLQEVKAGMTFEAVMTGLGTEYKLTKIGDSYWGVQQNGDDVGEIMFKDGVVVYVGQFLPAGRGDAASFIQELFNALYPHTRPATAEPANRVGTIRGDNAQIEIFQLEPDRNWQRISFMLSDGAQYNIVVIKNKSDKPSVSLVKVLQYSQ